MGLTMDKFPCQTCRARHYKCDRVVPVCGQCRISNRTCVPAFNIRFRREKVPDAADKGFHGKGTLIFSPDQEWVDTPRALTFVDGLAKQGEQGELSPGNDVDFADCHASSPCPAKANRRQRTTRDRVLEYSQSSSPGSIPVEGDISEHIEPVHADSTGTVNDSVSDTDRASTNFPLTVYSLPDQDNVPSDAEAGRVTPEYAQLLHYFKATIGWPWFDITDPNFTMEALRLAPTTPLLLYALLATACIHKSRREPVQSVAYELEMQAEDLHEKCISILLPIIQQAELVTDSAFLACNTILRFYEEISAPVHGRDDARHLLGGSASVAEFQNQELDFDSLSRAAFWVHLRQDTVVAIMNYRGPHMNLDFPDLAPSLNSVDGYTWAKRATWIHAEVVEFCFGSDVSSPRRFQYLMDKLDEWDRWKPEIFNPSFYQSADPVSGRFFPGICLTLDLGALGLSYQFFSLLLMAIYDPTVPRIGPEFLGGRRRTKNRVLHYLRLLCGLAWSNPVPPARATVCLAISQCGAWVSDAREQDAMIETLQMIERDDVWPTMNAQEALHRQWEQDRNEEP